MDAPKRRGRPPGSRNKPKDAHGNPMPLPANSAFAAQSRMVPPAGSAGDDYRHADPDAIVSRQLAMLDWAQQAMRNEMKRAMASRGVHISYDDVAKLEKLSNAVVRAIDALKKSSSLADELAARLTPEQLLEAALRKIEGQDLATLNYAIKRLRAHRERLAPISGVEQVHMGDVPHPTATATSAIASLTDAD